MPKCCGLKTKECYAIVDRNGQLCHRCQITQLKSLLAVSEIKATKWEEAYRELVDSYKAFLKSIQKKAASIRQ